MDWKRQTGLSAHGWLIFWAAAAVILPGLFFSSLAVGRAFIVPSPAITPGITKIKTTPPHSPSLRASPHRTRPHGTASRRGGQPPAATGQARIPGVGSTGGYGVTSVPPAHHYRPSSTAPAVLAPRPATSTPAPAVSTPEPLPDPPPGTGTPPPPDATATPTATLTDTAAPTGTTTPAADATPSAAATDPTGSLVPFVPDGGSSG